MYELDLFQSRFFLIERAINNKELMNVLNTIKKDTDNLVSVQGGQNGPTYKTNYFQQEVHGKLFKPIIEEIEKWLAKDNVSFKLTTDPWYVEYGEYDFHEPHIHTSECPTNTALPYNIFRYSGLICLSDFGQTRFINPNKSSFSNPTVLINSEYGRVILFPSNIYHYVIPHGMRDKIRAVFSFNCDLKMGPFNANV